MITLKNDDAIDSMKYFWYQQAIDDLKKYTKNATREQLLEMILELQNKNMNLQIMLFKIKKYILSSNFYVARSNKKNLFGGFLNIILDIIEGRI